METQENAALQALSPLYVERGLFALRYVSAEDSDGWPTAKVFLPSELNGKVRQICAPGVEPGELSGPGACLVLHAEAPGLIRISLQPAPSGSLQAVIKLERLDLNNSNLVVNGANAFEAQDERENEKYLPEIAFLAHISRQGDVEVAPRQWVAGPEAPAPIEGLLIKRQDVGAARVEIQVLSVGVSGWSSWCGPGTFAGSRGRGRPLIGLRARLGGPQAQRWALAAEAMFLGSPLIERKGREIEVLGQFGADPLVGLRLIITRVQAAPTKLSEVAVARTPRLKVFRSDAAAGR